MGNTCVAQSGVIGGDRKHGAAVAKTGGGNGGFSVISRPVSTEPKSTRGFTSQKVYKIAGRIFYRSRKASKVEETQDITEKYLIERRPIGRGHFGVVRRCIDKETADEFAVKTISKIKVNRVENLRREIAIMRRVNHPNIIKLHDVYEDDTFIHLVMDLCTGGDMVDGMIRKKESQDNHYTEKQAKVIVSQILSGIVYCHNELNICHRDLKLENLLFEGPNIKIIDFGLSRFVDGLSTMTTFAGTPYYMAPEVFARNYTRACDLWSLGVITFILLSGNVPFDGETNQEVFAAVRNGYFDFKAPEWNNISKKAKGFITQLLKKDPSVRMTATQAMEHPWLQTLPYNRNSLAGDVKTEDGEGDVINMQDM